MRLKTKDAEVTVEENKHPTLFVSGKFEWPDSDKVFRSLLNDSILLVELKWETVRKFSAKTRARYFELCRFRSHKPSNDTFRGGVRDCNTVKRPALATALAWPGSCRAALKGMDGDDIIKLWQDVGFWDFQVGSAIAEGCPEEYLPILLGLTDSEKLEGIRNIVERRLRGPRKN